VIKAQPHRSSKYAETVCCAGIGRDGKWRRQYPVPFRNLKPEQKFKRWDWISYDWVRPKDDLRLESQKVTPESIEVGGNMTPKERLALLNPLIRTDFKESNVRRDSLTLIRPTSIHFAWKKKSEAEIKDTREKHAALSKQLSFLDTETEDLEPCPYSFRLRWVDKSGGKHDHEMDDWETMGAYGRFQNKYGEEEALKILKEKYEGERFNKGLVLAFSTHKRRNATRGMQNQWLLVGLLSLADTGQTDMFIS